MRMRGVIRVFQGLSISHKFNPLPHSPHLLVSQSVTLEAGGYEEGGREIPEEFTVTVSDLHYREGSDLHYREEGWQ